MPDILIMGISLDDCFGKTIEIGRDADGHVFVYVDNGETAVLDVAELPPHGDLIDRDALIKVCNEMSAEEWNTKVAPYSWAYAYESFVDDVEDIPAVIPAERSGE